MKTEEQIESYERAKKILNNAFKKTLGVNLKDAEDSIFNLEKNKIVDGNLIIMGKTISKKLVKD